MLGDEGQRRLGRLLVAVDRCCLAAPHMPFVANLDLDDVIPVTRLARDHEGFGEVQPDDVGVDLHGGSLRPTATRRRGSAPSME